MFLLVWVTINNLVNSYSKTQTLESEYLSSVPVFTIFLLCDLGQVTQPLHISYFFIWKVGITEIFLQLITLIKYYLLLSLWWLFIRICCIWTLFPLALLGKEKPVSESNNCSFHIEKLMSISDIWRSSPLLAFVIIFPEGSFPPRHSLIIPPPEWAFLDQVWPSLSHA